VAFAQRNPAFNEQGLRDVLARQHGLITAEQLAAGGFSPPMITRRVNSGELERVLPKVYRSPLVPASAAQQALRAVLWAGDGVVASHHTAARLWRLDVDGTTADPSVWVPSARAPRNPNVVVHRGDIADIDRRLVDGVPVTSPARTLIDLASRLEGEPLEAAVEDALRRGLTTQSMLERRLAAVGGKGRPGAEHLRRILAARDDAPLESRLEVRVWRLLRSAGLRPVRQFEVRCEGQAYRLDFAWPVLKVAVEADGYRAHGGRIAHVGDRRRLADLGGMGWVIIPVTWEECLQHPGVVVQRVRSALLDAA
jgi:very-short-patch-repair endonuclease